MNVAAQGLKWAAVNVFTSSTIQSWQESLVRGQVQPLLDSNFQSWAWDEESGVSSGRLAIRDLVPKTDSVNSALLSTGFQLAEEATIERLTLTLPLKWAADLGIFSEPWMLDVSGVRVKLRACNAAEKEASTARNTEAVRAGMETAHPEGSNYEAGTDKASKAPSSSGGMFQEMFPLLQAMENMHLSLKDMELAVLHPHDPGALLRLHLEDCTVQTTSGPPDWRKTYVAVSQSARIYKIARLRGLSVTAEQQEEVPKGGGGSSATEASSSAAARTVLLDGVSVLLRLSKSPLPGARGPSDFVAGSYEARAVVEGASRPLGRFEAEVSVDVSPGSGISVAWTGPQLRIHLDHAVPPDELSTASSWASALSGAFAECQPEADLRLEAAQRQGALEAAGRLREKARATGLQARCEALQEQLRMERARRAAEEEWRAECARAAPELRRMLQAAIPRASTAEQEAAAAVDEMLLRLVPGYCNSNTISNSEEDTQAFPMDHSGRDGAAQPGVLGLMRGLHRTLNKGSTAAAEAAVTGIEAEAEVFRPPFEEEEQEEGGGKGPQGAGRPPLPPAPREGGSQRLLRVVKRVASDAGQLARSPANVDFFSRSDLWVGIKLQGSTRLHSFTTGPLHTNEAFGSICAPAGDVEMVALWLDLESSYELGEAVHREDFTFALGALEISIEEQLEDGTLLDTVIFAHSFLGAQDTAKVFDSRTAVVVDRLGSEGRNRRVTTIAMHSFSHAGKTKWWEHTWDTMEHIYPDKWIGNRFSLSGNWVGAGHGARIGVVRDYGGSVPVEHVLRSRLSSSTATGSRPVSACSDMSSWADVAPEELPEEDEDGDIFVDAREELSASFLASSLSSPELSPAPNNAPPEATPCALTITKKSWAKASQRKRLAVNADHFSKAPLHVALRLRGRKEWHKFDTGTLAQQVSVVKAESCGGWEDDEAAVDMAVLWLDLASVYAAGDPLAREDLTIALNRLTVELASTSIGSDSRPPLLDHSFYAGVASQVWDSRNAVIIDMTAMHPWLFTVNMHTSSKAGKTKWREGVWESQQGVYPDKWISNSFDAVGNWAGPGKGCHGGAYRHHGRSSAIETILEKLSGGTNELHHLRGVRP